MKKAVFPGSFDPVTLGHQNIVMRALPLFDEIVIGIGSNTGKKYFFTEEQREQFLKKVFGGESKIKVMRYSGLTVEFCKKMHATYILRGIRSASDFEFEKVIAQMNRQLAPEIETVFLTAEPALSHITSTVVRDILLHKGDVSKFVPKGVM